MCVNVYTFHHTKIAVMMHRQHIANKSCHTHVCVIRSHTHVRVMSCIYQTYIYTHAEWVTSPTWRTHVTHVYVSCHTYVYESCHTCMGHVTHTCMSHVTRVWVMSPTWMNIVVADIMNGSCHTHVWVMSYIFRVMPYNQKGMCVNVSRYMCVNVSTHIDIWGGYGQ